MRHRTSVGSPCRSTTDGVAHSWEESQMAGRNGMITEQAPGATTSQPFLAPLIGLGIYLVAVVLGLARDVGAEPEQGLADWVLTLVIALAGVVAATWATARAHSRGAAAVSSLVLGVLAVLTIVVFWAGFPCVLGVTAVALGRQARAAGGSGGGAATAGILLGVIATVTGAIVMVVG